MNIDTLTELRNLPWSGQSELNRTIVAQGATDYGPEQFEASLAAVVYEASRPMFIRNRFLPANATEEFYYQRIAQISDDVVVYQRIHGNQSNPLQYHICIVFKGTSTNYDYWTDFNILAEPITGTSVFQQQIDSTVLNLTGMLSGLTLIGNTISFIGHSLGFHKSECVLYKLLENNVINPAVTTVLQYGFAPLVWNDSNHQLITLAVAQIVSGNTAYSKYSPLANNTSIYCIEGDYVSLLQKVDWVGYGTTYTRPNVSNTLISSTVDFYTNGVLTESINHTIGNWIDGVDKFPEVVEETPLESSTDSSGVGYLTTGNDWFITNALHVSFSTYNHHLSLEADSLGSNISVNIYHDSDPDDLQYKWTLTKDSSIANSIIYTDLGSHYIAFQYTVANTASGFTRTVRFRKDSHVPSGTTRDYYLIEDATQGLYFQIKANPTETTVDHLAGWDLSAPLPSLSTYNNYSSTDDKERTLWYLSHFTNDRQRETAWIDPQDGLRRHLYPVSLSPYVPPIVNATITLTPTSYAPHVVGNQALNQSSGIGLWPLQTSVSGLNQGSGAAGSFSTSDSSAIITGYYDRTYILALRTSSGNFFHGYDKTKFYSITSGFAAVGKHTIAVSGLPSGQTVRIFHSNYSNHSWHTSSNNSGLGFTNHNAPTTAVDFFGNGNNNTTEYYDVPNGSYDFMVPQYGLIYIYTTNHKP